jgi:hypothetical protein
LIPAIGDNNNNNNNNNNISPITPQMEAFIVVNFLNHYQYWRLRYDLELIHPKIPIQKKPKAYKVPPLKEGETNKGLVSDHSHQEERW